MVQGTDPALKKLTDVRIMVLAPSPFPRFSLERQNLLLARDQSAF